MTSQNLPDGEPGGSARPLVPLAAAFQFLTIMPAIVRRSFTSREMGKAVGYFPVVGLVLGGVLAGFYWLVLRLFPQPVSAVLLLAAWIGLTGGLHLDGFLDACDGLFGGHDTQSRLQVMRDERLGAFAFAGGAILLLLKFTSLNAVTEATTALLLAPLLSRWGMALAVVAFPYARQEGVGLAMKIHATWREALWATLVALPAAWLLGSWRGLVSVIVVILVVWISARFTLSRIPGLTGDIYGAINEISEAVVLLVFSASVWI